jgi:hypothetical protein
VAHNGRTIYIPTTAARAECVQHKFITNDIYIDYNFEHLLAAFDDTPSAPIGLPLCAERSLPTSGIQLD